MIDRHRLLADLKPLVSRLENDLRHRLDEQPDLDKPRRDEYDAAREASRTGDTYHAWRDEHLTKVAAAWVLGSVFVRFLEDNGLARRAAPLRSRGAARTRPRSSSALLPRSSRRDRPRLPARDLVAVSNGSACTSASYEASHVLLAMAVSEKTANPSGVRYTARWQDRYHERETSARFPPSLAVFEPITSITRSVAAIGRVALTASGQVESCSQGRPIRASGSRSGWRTKNNWRSCLEGGGVEPVTAREIVL